MKSMLQRSSAARGGIAVALFAILSLMASSQPATSAAESNGEIDCFSATLQAVRVPEAEGVLNHLLDDQQVPGGSSPRNWHITSDEATNSILVVGPPEKVALAKKTLAEIEMVMKSPSKTALNPKQLLESNAPKIMDKLAGVDPNSVPALFAKLTEATGKPVLVNRTPSLGMIICGPPIKTRSVPEFIDIINEELLSNITSKQCLLIQWEHCFTLMPAYEKLEPNLLPLVQPDDLEKHGSTELAKTVLPLRWLVAAEVAPGIKKMMGQFGEVIPAKQGNQLLLMDHVGNLKLIRKMIEDIEKDILRNNDCYSQKLAWIPVREAERILKDVLADTVAPPIPVVSAAPSRGGRGSVNPGNVASMPKSRVYHLTTDEATNSILVVGPPDKVELAKKTLADVDVTCCGGERPKFGPAVMKIYNIPNGNAEAIASTLQVSYRNVSSMTIIAAGTNSIIVYAFPEDQIEIGKQIGGCDHQAVGAALVACGELPSSEVVDCVAAWIGDSRHLYVHAIAGEDDNAVILRGPPDVVEEAKALIEDMVSEPAMKTYIYQVPAGTAEEFAKTFQKLFKGEENTSVAAAGDSFISVEAEMAGQFRVAKYLLNREK